METLEKKILINQLLDLYGKLLTDNQQEIMNSYYSYDLSLSEIAANHIISRSAVLDMIKKSELKLEHYEECLGLREKNIRINKLLDTTTDINKLKDDIREEINNGI
ncbi:MAG: hypothetical protein RR578_03350 [Bacilli bacterium]